MQTIGETLRLTDLPHIWISNKADTFHGLNGWSEKQPIERLAPWFTPSWQLRPGFHFEANAELITRWFITSSIFNDVVLQRKAVSFLDVKYY